MRPNNDAATPSGALVRGSRRAALLLGLAALTLLFMPGQSQPGNRFLAWCLFAIFIGLCSRVILDTALEVRRVRRRQG